MGQEQSSSSYERMRDEKITSKDYSEYRSAQKIQDEQRKSFQKLQEEQKTYEKKSEKKIVFEKIKEKEKEKNLILFD